MLPLKVYAFLEQRNQTPIKTDGQDDPASRTASRLLAEMLQTHRLLQLERYYPNYLKVPSKISVPQKTV